MNIETGEIRPFDQITADEWAARSKNGGPLWVPLLKRKRGEPTEQRSQTQRNRAKRDRKKART